MVEANDALSEPTPALRALYRGDRAEGLELLGDKPSVFEAAAFGLTEQLASLLSDRRAARLTGPDGFTPLHLAAFFGHADAAQLLVDAGADLEAEVTNSFLTAVRPLHSAAAGGFVDCCRVLAAAGGDVNARQGGGFTPLMAAAASGNIELAQVLLGYGADGAAINDEGKSAATLARENGHHVLAQKLDS
ncbi:MAG: ankyrin repeat domain-containing protein [Actinomycetota bacterium]|nr:ankyrin repeat domain-containing protein [Actinomycetota bacterium]